MGRDAVCVLRNEEGQQVSSQIVSTHKTDQLVFKDLPSHHRFYLNCQVLAKKGENVNSLVTVLADTGTKEITTKRSVLSTLITIVVVLGVLSCVLFVILQIMRINNERRKMGL